MRKFQIFNAILGKKFAYIVASFSPRGFKGNFGTLWESALDLSNIIRDGQDGKRKFFQLMVSCGELGGTKKSTKFYQKFEKPQKFQKNPRFSGE